MSTASKLFSEKSWEILVALITVAFFCGVTWLKADEADKKSDEAKVKAETASVDVAMIKKDVEYIVKGMDTLIESSKAGRKRVSN